MFRKLISWVLIFCFSFSQTSFAQLATELNLAGYLSRMHSGMTVDKFRPVHLRYFNYDPSTQGFKVMVDKGDAKDFADNDLQASTSELLNYFLTGITLPNESFWVNLRPDSEDQIIDGYLEKTDLGKVMLETDLQLKKDTAQLTSPATPEGKEYWNRLYKKASELFGNENVSIPTLTRPWIVPGEIIVYETDTSAYVYKAVLKVMLEQDYLKDSSTYSFKDPRSKALNDYSSELIRELIIPKLTKQVNSSKRYAGIRQAYYSLILSRWFKDRFTGQAGGYASRINTSDLTGLLSQEPWSKTTYFKEYQKSFKEGEYNLSEPVSTPTGQVIRSYFSGGIAANLNTFKLDGVQDIFGQNVRFKEPPLKDGYGVEFNADGTMAGSSPAAASDESPARKEKSVSSPLSEKDTADINSALDFVPDGLDIQAVYDVAFAEGVPYVLSFIKDFKERYGKFLPGDYGKYVVTEILLLLMQRAKNEKLDKVTYFINHYDAGIIGPGNFIKLLKAYPDSPIEDIQKALLEAEDLHHWTDGHWDIAELWKRMDAVFENASFKVSTSAKTSHEAPSQKIANEISHLIVSMADRETSDRNFMTGFLYISQGLGYMHWMREESRKLQSMAIGALRDLDSWNRNTEEITKENIGKLNKEGERIRDKLRETGVSSLPAADDAGTTEKAGSPVIVSFSELPSKLLEMIEEARNNAIAMKATLRVTLKDNWTERFVLSVDEESVQEAILKKIVELVGAEQFHYKLVNGNDLDYTYSGNDLVIELVDTSGFSATRVAGSPVSVNTTNLVEGLREIRASELRESFTSKVRSRVESQQEGFVNVFLRIWVMALTGEQVLTPEGFIESAKKVTNLETGLSKGEVGHLRKALIAGGPGSPWLTRIVKRLAKDKRVSAEFATEVEKRLASSSPAKVSGGSLGTFTLEGRIPAFNNRLKDSYRAFENALDKKMPYVLLRRVMGGLSLKAEGTGTPKKFKMYSTRFNKRVDLTEDLSVDEAQLTMIDEQKVVVVLTSHNDVTATFAFIVDRHGNKEMRALHSFLTLSDATEVDRIAKTVAKAFQGLASSPTLSSPAQLKDDGLGGIDFRSLPMTIKPLGSFQNLNMSLPKLSIQQLASFDVGQELKQLQQMASSGIVPSGDRVQELVNAALQKGELEEYQGEILTMMAEVCKLQEGECCETSDEFKVALLAANSV